MKKTELPKAFCWSKVGTESGETIDAIFKRKEWERQLNDGIFYWGIGNSLGNKVWELINMTGKPHVFFSHIKSKPKKADSNPTTVLLWMDYIDRFGNINPLPTYTMVTSRGNMNDSLKNKHYALVCRRKNKIKHDIDQEIDFYGIKNLGSEKNTVAFSQVTAIVEQHNTKMEKKKNYPILFSSELYDPYFVTLANPIPLSKKAIDELRSFSYPHRNNSDDWKIWVLNIKKKLKNQKGTTANRSNKQYEIAISD